MYFANPLSMMQRTLAARPGGAPAPSFQYGGPQNGLAQQWMNLRPQQASQQIMPQQQMMPQGGPSVMGQPDNYTLPQQPTMAQPQVMPAQQFMPPTMPAGQQQFYGPAHQALTQAFTNSLKQQTNAPTVLSQMMRYPHYLPQENGGLNIQNIVAPKPNNDWRINWFPQTQEGDATKAAVQQTGGLLAQPIPMDTGVRQGQNDVPGGGF